MEVAGSKWCWSGSFKGDTVANDNMNSTAKRKRVK
jgi:hypothetical protein